MHCTVVSMVSGIGHGMYAKKKVVIVDDSRTIRHWLRVVLESDPRLEVVGEADCAPSAWEVIKRRMPDVVTLDIEMPGMSGLAFLEKLMGRKPMPVVMISGATQSNSEATITALSLGAIDCILKPTRPSDADVTRDITRRVFSAACSSVRTMRRPPRTAPAVMDRNAGTMPIVLIGASTGGVGALECVLADLPMNGPPVVIVQHMPGAFLVSFSQMLDKQLHLDVAVVREDEPLGRGQVRLAPAMGKDTIVRRVGASWQCQFKNPSAQSLHCPSVDALFQSASGFGKDVIGVILTGLGRDGAAGLLDLRKAGAITLGQDAETSVVYGMPRAAKEMGAVEEQLPISKIGKGIVKAVERHASGRRA